MSKEKTQQLPIGYWLKRADELLTARIDGAQRANSLTRLEWQTLNVVRDNGTATRDEVVGTLRPFADATTVHDVLEGLAQRGLFAGSLEDRLELTRAGMELYERALSSQKAIRQRAVAGISEAEYVATVGVLRRLVENLERDDAS